MPDYQDNPLFNDQIKKFDGAVPNISFDYKWNTDMDRWVPNTGDPISIGDIDIGDIDLSDTETHGLLLESNKLLSGISGVLESQDGGGGGSVDDQATHALLSGISGLIVHSHGMFNDNHTHLQSVKEAVENFGEENDANLTLLIDRTQGVDTELNLLNQTAQSSLVEEIEQNDNLELIFHKNSGILTTAENIEDLTETSNVWLSGVSGAISSLEMEVGDIAEDKEAHRILSGISGQDLTHYDENERLLQGIKDNSCNTTLALEELKKNFREVTYHIKKFEEKNLLQEALDFEEISAKEYEVPLMDRIHHAPRHNGRLTDRETTETQQYLLNYESYPEDNPEREYVFDESAPFSVKLEDYQGGEGGWHSFYPFDKKLGLDDRITIFNESPFPFDIMFRGGENFTIFEGHQIELTKEEASQLYIKRDYTISGFEVRYSIERMYTPEQKLFDELEDPEFLLPEQTHARIGLGSVMMNNTHVYISHGNIWKRIAIASWETCEYKTSRSYPIDYFDAYTTAAYLHLSKSGLSTTSKKRRVAIADWETCSKIPLECHNNLWADDSFLYAKIAEAHDDSWKRYPISEYNEQ